MNSGSNQATTKRHSKTLWLVLIALCILLRISAPNSDPYPQLSWSSALVTDEGFYTQSARNENLFPNQAPDEFDNALIMPVLNSLQRTAFFFFGVGFLQARAISVITSLASILLMAAAMRRVADERAALIFTALYGLDHVPLLYSRMALMDTPAVLPLALAFYAFVRLLSAKDRRSMSIAWGLLCGLSLIAAYGTRGLAFIALPAPFIALWAMREKQDEDRRLSITKLLAVGSGVAIGLTLYVVLWYLPHHTEIGRLNRFYVTQQLLPSSLAQMFKNLGNALFGNERGISPFLFRHSPILVIGSVLAVAQMVWSLRERRSADASKIYLAVWMMFGMAFCASVSYAPSRYFVLFYPAMAALCALYITAEPQESSSRLWRILPSLAAYHGVVFLLNDHEPMAFIIAGIVAVAAYVFTAGLTPRFKLLPIWLAVNALWLLHWGVTLDYSQQRTAQWLNENVPANSVIYGDVASGLSLATPFRTIAVIPELCNDDLPIIVPGAPRYLMILDEPFLPKFWKERHPNLIRPEMRIQRFEKVVKYPVALFKLP